MKTEQNLKKEIIKWNKNEENQKQSIKHFSKLFPKHSKNYENYLSGNLHFLEFVQKLTKQTNEKKVLENKIKEAKQQFIDELYFEYYGLEDLKLLDALKPKYRKEYLEKIIYTLHTKFNKHGQSPIIFGTGYELTKKQKEKIERIVNGEKTK